MPQKVNIVIDDDVADLLEASGLPVLWRSQAPFYAAELQVLRAVDCCLRRETACFGDMEDRVAQHLSEAIQAASTEMTSEERNAFFGMWDQLDEEVQLYVLNGYSELPPMECGPKDCKMRAYDRAVPTHTAGLKIN
ncbi:hypothetical protein LOKVESSMR4R_00726 [Yoonia vestfoldensis]|uniref:Uncharacterized protein n=1 Tax=Yoonia vestfoldensis TaxID=245188 RepID=A0A1Y0E9M1_9RHOB|nr:hypothetical protein LOKVESSMR4R_00726 [Yoonia vestfoldensis]